MRLENWDDTAARSPTTGSPGGAHLAALRRRWPQRSDHGARRGRQNFLATALGHAAIRRRISRALRTGRPAPQTPQGFPARQQPRRRATQALRVDLLIIDDFALQPLDALDTADIYELIVERHRAAATVVTSNRDPIEWLAMMADALLAQSAIDRLKSAAHELVLDGESYRVRQKPTVTPPAPNPTASSRKKTAGAPPPHPRPSLKDGQQDQRASSRPGSKACPRTPGTARARSARP